MTAFRSDGVSSPFATAAATTTLLLVVAGIGLDLRGEGTAMLGEVDWFVGAVGALGYAVPGAQVWRRSAGNTVGPLSVAIGFGFGLSYVAGVYSTYGLESVPGSLPAAAYAEWLALWLWALPYCLIPTVLLLVMPNGRLLSRRWRPALWLAVTAVVLASLGWAVSPYDRRDATVTSDLTNPVGASWGPTVLNAAIPLLLIAALAGFVSVGLRFRRATGLAREQAAWVLFGGLATVALVGLGQLVPYGGAGQYVSAAALLPLPMTLGVAVLRHGLWDIDTLLHRTVVHGALVVVLVSLHAAVVAGVSTVADDRQSNPVLAAAVVAVAAMPAYARLRVAAGRLIFGNREEPWVIVAALADRFRAAPSVPDLIDDITTTLAERLRLGHVTIDLDEHAGSTRHPAAIAAFELPLERAGRDLGTLRARGRADGSVGPTERRVLTDLAPHIAAAIEASVLADALHASRDEIVRAREEERRWLRGELHDGVGPTLAAVALELESTRDLVGDHGPLDAQLDRLAARLNDVVADVRRVVDGLRPASLDDLGLVGAVEAQITRLSSAACPVSLSVDGPIPPLPAAVDLAVLRIVSEAVTNAVRHSRGTACHVLLTAVDDAIRVRVTDDGVGIGDAPPGVGLASMRQRADELGGTFRVVASDGGTTVEVRLPLERRSR